MEFQNDPIGFAIHDFLKNRDESAKITVQSDLCDDDILPVPYLFRTYELMPALEKEALKEVKGKILDIGAGAGCHAFHLIKKGYEVTAIEKSKGAAAYLKTLQVPTFHGDFLTFDDGKYDTILLLMNGIGLAGSLAQLPKVLKHLHNLLKPGGILLTDSTDIHYMYENEDGSVWMDLAAAYYGEMKFNMVYKDVESGWFPWLYIDPEKFAELATDAGFKYEILFEGENNHYLASLKKI